LPLNLKAFDALDWMTRDDFLEHISWKLDRIRKVPVLTQLPQFQGLKNFLQPWDQTGDT
jgi:hypothetical protein